MFPHVPAETKRVSAIELNFQFLHKLNILILSAFWTQMRTKNGSHFPSAGFPDDRGQFSRQAPEAWPKNFQLFLHFFEPGVWYLRITSKSCSNVYFFFYPNTKQPLPQKESTIIPRYQSRTTTAWTEKLIHLSAPSISYWITKNVCQMHLNPESLLLCPAFQLCLRCTAWNELGKSVGEKKKKKSVLIYF